jgi:hypothetical protein
MSANLECGVNGNFVGGSDRQDLGQKVSYSQERSYAMLDVSGRILL